MFWFTHFSVSAQWKCSNTSVLKKKKINKIARLKFKVEKKHKSWQDPLISLENLATSKQSAPARAVLFSEVAQEKGILRFIISLVLRTSNQFPDVFTPPILYLKAFDICLSCVSFNTWNLDSAGDRADFQPSLSLAVLALLGQGK